MASNHDWVPLPQKKNGSSKKTRENQTKILRQLKEMFGSTFELDIIISVAQNCNWKLEPSIDALITLSSNVQTPMHSSNTSFEEENQPKYDSWSNQDFPNIQSQNNSQQINEEIFLNMNHNELGKQHREIQKFENTRWTDVINFGSSSEPNQKVGTASLCGLKVQYRLKGTENSDDDADVVIEEESSDYRIKTPEPERVNVCQFLSAPTQCSSRNTFPKVNYINTPSSPRTSQRIPPVILPTISSRLENDINEGYKILIIMRGAPGCGKTYLARNIVSKTVGSNFAAHIFGTDDYFMKINRGVYTCNASKISEAHSFNYNRVLNAMRQGISPIIVDNTNTRAWEMQNYAIIAVEHGYIVETLEPDTPWFRNVHELVMRNKHNVPKARIRAMLERYEPNITGTRLLNIYSLSYAEYNQPPQLRQYPPFSAKQSIIRVNNIPSVPHTSQFKSPSNENPTERLIDNEALNIIAKEFTKPEPINTRNSNSSNINKVFNESWTDSSSYKEDSLLLDMKLGAIGSERKVAHNLDQPEVEDTNIRIREESNQLEDTMPMIAEANTNNDAHVLNEGIDEQQCETMKGKSMSTCWDFTLLMNGRQIHSKIDEPFHDDKIAIDAPTVEPDLIAEDTEVSYILASNVDKDYSSSQDTETPSEAAIINLTDLSLEDAYVQPISYVLEEIPTPSDNTRSSSDSGSLERVSDVDISQFEMCSTETIDDVKILNDELTREDTNSEKQSTGGLGLLFSFIKNTIIGNDKEKFSKETQHESTDTPEDYAICAQQFDKLLNDNSVVKKPFPPTFLPDKPLELSENDQEGKDFCPINNDIDTPTDASFLNTSLNESNEFFEAPKSPQKESAVMNVVEELLEASSEVEQVEQLDFSERRTATKSEELEKNFSERMENLHIRAKSEEEENKVSKEPIHLVFGGKNIFPEKIQAQANGNQTSTKPSISSSSSNGNGGNGGNGNIATSNDNVANVFLIDWRESPFPLDETPLITTEAMPVKKKPETCERETYTDPYDFNVVYVGGTDDYKILKTVNRNINEASRHLSNDVEEPPMHKLMLHKSTMTNTSIFFKGLVDTCINEDRSEELYKHFPHLPRVYVSDIYDNLCKRDYNWALDHLNNMQPEDVMMYESLIQQDAGEKIIETTEVSGTAKTMQRPNVSDSLSTETYEIPRQTSQQQKMHSRSKRERYRASGDLLALKQQLEGKFVMSEESYAPHTLRVKRWKRREFDEPNLEVGAGDLMSFEEQPPFMALHADAPPFELRKPSRLDHPAMEEEEEEQPTEDEDSIEDEEVVEEEMMELRLGYEFIRVLESEFGSANFQASEGLFPVIQIRRSMAQELHALWIESMQQQLWVMQEQLDTMIAKDAEFARSLEVHESKSSPASDVPNLKEIMDMEMALATYSNDCVKQKYMKKTLNDLASHVTQQTLHEMFPGYDPEMLYEIYEAHGRNFEETVKVIEENCSIKSTITMADVLKKRKNLIDELQKESSYQTSRHNQLENLENGDEASGGDYNNYENLQTYEDAIEVARYSRAEARQQLALRNENYQKASEAYRKKNPEVAAYYSDVAKLHIRNMEVANSMAASALLAAQTHVLEADDTLDLHFLHVPEAIHALDLFLEHQLHQLAKGSRKYVFIITGRGARSSNGQSKIKPVVERKLNSKNIRFSEANPGMLKALLRKK